MKKGSKTRSRVVSGMPLLVLLVVVALLTTACGGVARSSCGAGTTLKGSVCVTEARTTCGPGAELDNGLCVVSNTKRPTPGSPDTTPPTFAGAESAEASGDGAVLVSWSPATDDVTPSAQIVYEVAWGDRKDFSPDWASAFRSAPGATSALIAGLPSPGTLFFFVVRAVDAAGNADHNAVIVGGSTSPDGQPPVFSGCRAVSAIQAESLRVDWDPASDNGTDPSALGYEVWLRPAGATGNARDGTPTKVVTGVTGVTLDGLDAGMTYLVLCGVRDAAGNQDNNEHELTVTTLADTTSPQFGGVVSGSLVSPGVVTLTWDAATDDVTAATDIAYDIYAATAPGKQYFSLPPLLTVTGVSEATVPGLASDTTQYFVVRARDRAGNEDVNTKELALSLPVSFALDVAPILVTKCAGYGGCHTAADPSTPPAQGLDLDLGMAYQQSVDVPAVESASLAEPGLKRVARTGVLADSYTWRKITDTPPYLGSIMPPVISPEGPLSADEQRLFAQWISDGAPDN